jgi:hypothetical protein
VPHYGNAPVEKYIPGYLERIYLTDNFGVYKIRDPHNSISTLSGSKGMKDKSDLIL